MAYSHPTLHRIGPANSDAPVIWTYASADTIATINTAGYFNDAADDLNVGDLIYIQSSTGGTRVATLAQVLSNDGTTVDIADGTTLAATDSD